jgi:hypothetical protein
MGKEKVGGLGRWQMIGFGLGSRTVVIDVLFPFNLASILD